MKDTKYTLILNAGAGDRTNIFVFFVDEMLNPYRSLLQRL